MSDKVKVSIVDADNKKQETERLVSNGYTVVSVESVGPKGENKTPQVKITAKDFNAKLGHLGREFAD